MPDATVYLGYADSLYVGDEIGRSGVNYGLPEGTYGVYHVKDDDGRLVALIIDTGLEVEDATARIAAAGQILRRHRRGQAQGQGLLAAGGQEPPARGQGQAPAALERLPAPTPIPRASPTLRGRVAYEAWLWLMLLAVVGYALWCSTGH